METKYYVVIIEDFTNKEVKRVGPLFSDRQAMKVERGMNINLNHSEYHTDIIVEEKEDRTDD